MDRSSCLTAAKLLKDFFENEGFDFIEDSCDIVCNNKCGFVTKTYHTITHIQFIHKLLHPKCKNVRYIPYKYENFAKSKESIENYSEAKKCVAITEEMMVSTFYSWPKRAPSVDKLVSAGFFYTGTSDEVMCVECKVLLYDWNSNDDPWIEHEKASPNCLLVKLYNKQF